MLGIISDTHDNLLSVKKAVEVFNGVGCDLIIHCGDVICPLTMEPFKGMNIKFVKGNCDGEVEGLKQKAVEINAEFFEDIYEFEYEGKKFLAYHGSDQIKLKKLIESKKYDYVLTGHTHKKTDLKVGPTRVINPGAHYPTVQEKTVAILDVPKDELRFMTVNKTVEQY
jgi:putative phosphoesterase